MTAKEQKAKYGTGTVYQYKITYNGRKSIKLWADSEAAAISRLNVLESSGNAKVKVSKIDTLSSLIYYTI